MGNKEILRTKYFYNREKGGFSVNVKLNRVVLKQIQKELGTLNTLNYISSNKWFKDSEGDLKFVEKETLREKLDGVSVSIPKKDIFMSTFELFYQVGGNVKQIAWFFNEELLKRGECNILLKMNQEVLEESIDILKRWLSQYLKNKKVVRVYTDILTA
jgi:hypothetical protein